MGAVSPARWQGKSFAASLHLNREVQSEMERALSVSEYSVLRAGIFKALGSPGGNPGRIGQYVRRWKRWLLSGAREVIVSGAFN